MFFFSQASHLWPIVWCKQILQKLCLLTTQARHRQSDRQTDRRTSQRLLRKQATTRYKTAVVHGLKEVEIRIIINRFQSVRKNDADRWTNGHGTQCIRQRNNVGLPVQSKSYVQRVMITPALQSVNVSVRLQAGTVYDLGQKNILVKLHEFLSNSIQA